MSKSQSLFSDAEQLETGSSLGRASSSMTLAPSRLMQDSPMDTEVQMTKGQRLQLLRARKLWPNNRSVPKTSLIGSP